LQKSIKQKNEDKVLLVGDPQISDKDFALSYRGGLLEDDSFNARNIVLFPLRYSKEEIQKNVCAVIHTRMPIHNPNFGLKDAKELKRKELSPDRQQIEEILDRTIRPGLQGDGGDIEVVEFKDNKVYVSYQGACGTCPSSTTGTLMAIEGILRDEFNSTVEVIPV
jgi:Fe-S cluster biogenesis protein NfuA